MALAEPAEQFAWSGGYERFAIMNDGETLYIPCVNDPDNPTHTDPELRDGWLIEGYSHTGETCELEICVHCSRLINEPDL